MYQVSSETKRTKSRMSFRVVCTTWGLIAFGVTSVTTNMLSVHTDNNRLAGSSSKLRYFHSTLDSLIRIARIGQPTLVPPPKPTLVPSPEPTLVPSPEPTPKPTPLPPLSSGGHHLPDTSIQSLTDNDGVTSALSTWASCKQKLQQRIKSFKERARQEFKEFTSCFWTAKTGAVISGVSLTGLTLIYATHKLPASHQAPWGLCLIPAYHACSTVLSVLNQSVERTRPL